MMISSRLRKTVAIAGICLAFVGCSSNDDLENGSVTPSPTPVETANRAPVLNNQLGDATIEQGTPPGVTRSLSAVFSDPDGDALTFSASSSQPSALQPSISSQGVLSVVVIDPEFIGAATFTVFATDPLGERAEGLLNVIVAPRSVDSIVVSQPTALGLAPGEKAKPLELQTLLQPTSGDFSTLVFSITSDLPGILSGEVDSSGRLLVEVDEVDASGNGTVGRSGTLTVRARDLSGATGDLFFVVNIKASAPTSNCIIDDEIESINGVRPAFLPMTCANTAGQVVVAETDLIDLDSVFSNLPAGESLTFSIASSNPDTASAALSNRRLRVTLQQQEGDAEIEISAVDGEGNTAYQSFLVRNRTGSQSVPVEFGEVQGDDVVDGTLPSLTISKLSQVQRVDVQLADFVRDANADDLDLDLTPFETQSPADDYSYRLVFNSAPQVAKLSDGGISNDGFGRLTIEVLSGAVGVAELLFEVTDDDGDISQATLSVEVIEPEVAQYVVSASTDITQRRVLQYDSSAIGDAEPLASFNTGLAAGVDFDEGGNLYSTGLLAVSPTNLNGEPRIRVIHNALNRANASGPLTPGASVDENGVPSVTFSAGSGIDREGPSAALVDSTPRNVIFEESTGLLLVISTGVDGATFESVKVFSPEAGDAAPPLYSITAEELHDENVSEFGDVWDAVYASQTGSAPVSAIPGAVANDALFLAMTDGRVIRCDDFVENARNNLPSDCRALVDGTLRAKAIIPEVECADGSDADGCVNLHGIDYIPRTDTLVVSDVGPRTAADENEDPQPDIGFDNDGSLYVFHQIGLSVGRVAPDLIVRQVGESNQSGLGNPVDLVVDGVDVLVAEKANSGGAVLRFENIGRVGFTPPQTGVAPVSALNVANPEIVKLDVKSVNLTDLSDIELRAPASGVLVQREATRSVILSGQGQIIPAEVGLDSVGQPIAPQFSGGSLTTPRRLVTTASPDLFGIDLSNVGAIYATVDDGAAAQQPGGLLAASLRISEGAVDSEQVRRTQTEDGSGEETDLVRPKGIDLVQEAGVAIVADVRLNTSVPAGSVSVFPLGGNGATPPIFTTLFDERKPWDVDYDPISDRLFVANTDGTVAIFDRYLEDRPNNLDAARLIFPAARRSGVLAKQSVNLHGIVHHRVTDNQGQLLFHELLLTDVGLAVGDEASDEDGRVFVLPLSAEEISAVSGAVEVDLQIRGVRENSVGSLSCDVNGNASDNQIVFGNPVDLVYAAVEDSLFIAEKSLSPLNKNALVHVKLIRDAGTRRVSGYAYSCATSPGAVRLESIQLAPEFLPL